MIIVDGKKPSAGTARIGDNATGIEPSAVDIRAGQLKRVIDSNCLCIRGTAKLVGELADALTVEEPGCVVAIGESVIPRVDCRALRNEIARHGTIAAHAYGRSRGVD